MAAGRSGLLHATTGSGKTYAVWFGALRPRPRRSASRLRAGQRRRALGMLWLTPMRALAADTARAHPGAARRARRSAWTRRHPHRRHAAGRARAAGPALPDGAGHHARVAEPDADPRAAPRRAGGRAHRHRRRVARADGQQARRAGAAGDRAAAALEPAARRLGPERDARQPGRGDAGAARPRRRRAGARPRRQDAGHRHAAAGQPGPLLLGRPPRQADAAAGGRRDRALVDDAGLRQHALAGRGLVPAAARGSGPSGPGSSRCTTARSTRRCATGSSWA